MAIGSKRSLPTAPPAAAVVSLGHDGAKEYTVVPVEGLGHEWNSGAAAATEEDC